MQEFSIGADQRVDTICESSTTAAKDQVPRPFVWPCFWTEKMPKIFYNAVDFDAKTNEGCTTVVLESDPAILEVDDAFDKPIAAALRDIPLITGAPSGKEQTVLTMAQFSNTYV